MARVTIEDCLTKVPNRFALVFLVTKRVKQLLKGDACLVEKQNNNIVNALREVAADKVTFDPGDISPDKQLEKDLRVEKKAKSYLQPQE